MADDVLKYRVKIFSILLLLQECCQLHLFHLGMDFVLMFPTRLVARVFPVGKATFPSAVGLVPCLQGWLPGNCSLMAALFRAVFVLLLPSVPQSCGKGTVGISESPGSWQCFVSGFACRGESWGHFFCHSAHSANDAPCPLPQWGPSPGSALIPPRLPNTHPLLPNLCCPNGPA